LDGVREDVDRDLEAFRFLVSGLDLRFIRALAGGFSVGSPGVGRLRYSAANVASGSGFAVVVAAVSGGVSVCSSIGFVLHPVDRVDRRPAAIAVGPVVPGRSPQQILAAPGQFLRGVDPVQGLLGLALDDPLEDLQLLILERHQPREDPLELRGIDQGQQLLGPFSVRHGLARLECSRSRHLLSISATSTVVAWRRSA
jgi:hypothetical protein